MKAPAERFEAQAEGRHPAPCARFCEANAFEIELSRLRATLKKANDQAEHFEREWYLRGDEIERMRGALITGACLLEQGCNAEYMAASMRRAAQAPEPKEPT